MSCSNEFLKKETIEIIYVAYTDLVGFFNGRFLCALTFSLGLVARHILAGVTETGWGKQAL